MPIDYSNLFQSPFQSTRTSRPSPTRNTSVRQQRDAREPAPTTGLGADNTLFSTNIDLPPYTLDPPRYEMIHVDLPGAGGDVIGNEPRADRVAVGESPSDALPGSPQGTTGGIDFGGIDSGLPSYAEVQLEIQTAIDGEIPPEDRVVTSGVSHTQDHSELPTYADVLAEDQSDLQEEDNNITL